MRTPPRAWLGQASGWHERTVRRHESKRDWPPWVARLLELELERELAGVHPDWTGWTISRAGELVAPSGAPYRPGEILAMQLRYQQIAALTRELRVLRAELQRRRSSAELAVPGVGTGQREMA